MLASAADNNKVRGSLWEVEGLEENIVVTPGWKSRITASRIKVARVKEIIHLSLLVHKMLRVVA